MNFRSTSALIVTSSICLAACDYYPLPMNGGTSSFPSDQRGIGVSTNIREDGALRARVYGDTADSWQDSAQMLLFPITVDFFDRNGAATGHLSADSGTLNTITQEMAATGAVLLWTADGDKKVLTEHLRYDPKRGIIWSEVRSTLIDGTSRVEGSGFMTDEGFSEVRVTDSTGEADSS